MTTIATNGYFLVADNRNTITIPGHPVYNAHSGEVGDEVLADTCIKINLINSDLTIGGSKIKAIAGAGLTTVINSFTEVINNYKVNENTDIKQIFKLLNNLYIGKDVDILGVTEDCKPFFISLNGDSRLSTNSPGCCIGKGSGSGILGTVLDLGTKLTMKEIIPLASRFDKFTSPSYSAYSTEENHLFGFVIPSQEDIFDITKKAVDKAFITYGNTNSFINNG